MIRFTGAAFAAALFMFAHAAAGAQQPDTARQRQDSLALVRELEAMARQDSAARAAAQGPRVQPTVQRLLPDISVVGDLIGDLSPDGTTQEDGTRLGVREVEVVFQAAVDPYFRGDVYLGFNDAEGVHLEQAYLTTIAVPSVELRLGRFLMPVTKLNTTHRHDLHSIEYPWVIQRFLGAEGLKGTGLYLSRIFAPLGFYQELQLSVVDRLAPHEHDDEHAGEPHLEPDEPPNQDLGGLGYSARLRNYWDLTQAANLEISASAATGKREQPLDVPTPETPPNAVNARQSLVGADVTFRWRPLQQGLYRSLIVQAEYLRQINERVSDPDFSGPGADFSGAYAFARWQLTRRTYIGGRYDWLEDPAHPAGAGTNFSAASGYFTWLPSEFSKLVIAWERTMPGSGVEPTNRVLLQATFALGPHRPHPF